MEVVLFSDIVYIGMVTDEEEVREYFMERTLEDDGWIFWYTVNGSGIMWLDEVLKDKMKFAQNED